ncbi:MAG: InlB B-repeat-containing protein, partial [Bacilli bacterium]|nr:InlB B-repeat-containing protein [Bacilli bacterium]
MDKDKRRKKKRRKKSKSGFTLIEIIGVIIIIGIIAIITVPAISKYVNNSKEKTYITYEENMKVATENKVVECISGNDKGCYLPESGEKKIVYLNELVESGYMDSLKDPENDGFCSNELSYVEVTNTNGANYEYKACLYCGNYTTEDTICTEYEFDAEKPVCGTVEGESTKWTNSNRTIIVGCSDSSSGCRSTTFSKTFTETTKNGEVTIVDRSGNTTNCPVEVYVDKTMPKCTLEIVGGTQEATGWLSGDVSVKLVSWSDSDSGVLTYGIGTSINNRNYNKQTSIKVNNGLTTVIGYVKDYAGNEGTCAVDVRVGAPKPEFDIEYGYQIYPSKEAYTLVNMTESGTKLTSTTTDPQISFTELNDYKEITRVRVRFNTAIPATTTAQLFYSNGTHTEANSVKALLVQGQKIVEFVVPKGSYKNLRLDLGSLNNTTFDIEKIEVMVGDRSTLFTNKNVSVNLIPKNETVRTTNYSFDNGATWQDINYKDYSDNITGSAKTKNIATLISDPAKTYKIENIDKGVPKVTITVTEKTNGAEVESNVWVDDNLNFKLVSSKVGASGATIYYCKDTNNTCNPTTEVASGTMVTALNTTEGIYYIRYKVVSGAGTSSEISSFTAKVDKTKPTITSVTGNATSWTNQDVTLVINGAKDGESKLPDKPYSFNGGETWQATNSKIYTANTNNIVIKVRDIAGNVYTHTAINITKIDKEKPSCELKVISGSQVNGYYYTDVTVGFAKTTDTGGSEVKEYGIEDFTTKTVTLNEDKNVTYTANIRDNAGNTNICTITVRRQNTFTLTYNSNGGNVCSPSSRDISYGSKYGALCSPTRAGYSFAGWYTEATGGTKITADTTVTATENQTLYAHWTKCDVGTYNTGNKSTCTACPTGYTSAEGSTAENQCYITIADGKYLGTAKSTTQTACPAGQFKASHTIYYGNTSSCSTCAAGTFSTGGAKTCTACPTGYTSAEGATAQNKCYINVSAGKYIATANSATQTACPAGTAGLTHTVYYGSTSSCTKCAIGTYSTGGAAICTVCPSGYTSAEGATAQNKCYINVDAGSYIKTANSATPVKCAAGTAKGNHTVYYGSTSSCVTCTAGKYSLEGAGSCSSCPTGYTSAEGATAQNKCYITVADGKYLQNANDTIQAACPAGTFKAQHNVYYGSASSCSTCATGTFSTGGAKVCTTCPTGYTSAAGSTAASQCKITCNGGYVASSGAKCTACPAGTSKGSHTVSYGSTSSCSSCAAGTYNTTTGNSSCTSCPAGSYCTGGTHKAACAANTYSTGGAKACTSCPSGYTSAAGSTAANQCKITCNGGYVASSGAKCTACPAGTAKGSHTVSNGSTSSCSPCAGGTYNSGTGNSSCTTCPAGSYCEGRTHIATCPAGKYSTGGASSCSSCPSGYTSAAGSTAQSKCYISCPGGRVATAGGGCTSCGAGTYNSGGTVYYGNTS